MACKDEVTEISVLKTTVGATGRFVNLGRRVTKALGRKGSGGNYPVRHFTRRFCTECQSSSNLTLGAVKLIATKHTSKYQTVKLKGK